MLDKQTYYVTLHAGGKIEVMPVKVNGRAIQYEVRAEDHEYERLQTLIKKINQKDIMVEHIFKRPFSEYRAAADKEDLEAEYDELMQYIYELGTSQTKDEMSKKE
ncbi:hypothetical protein LGQ02_13620 [Bacillus shivajii]|uniref:hypothetical protein n=1 Tax=Bacillus shivajii TaxID=1983719 RepID=UPI001CFA9881|nr:hypothetical protein [Bacillus shivajii]UCZ51890.1 hypothetical protein LGQ02_13620 [Bacillus shivajii]